MSTQTPVAAKSLKRLATDRDRQLALADFQIEAKLLANLRHPNICMVRFCFVSLACCFPDL